MLTTAYMVVGIDSSILTCEFRLNQSGNLDLTDNAYIQYQINDGEWSTETALSGYGLDAVFYHSFLLKLYYNDYIRFRIVYETNDNTEFWALQNGDISITGDFELYNPLPVEFISINCSTGINAIILSWTTASETNNDYFTIERSDNGIDFYTIGIVNGAGNSNDVIEYIYNDDAPLFGNNYYRIRQTDFDGQYSFSETVSANFQNSTQEMVVHSENGTVAVSITSENETNATLTFFDITGKSVICEHYRIKEGSNELFSNAGNLPAGIYIICLSKTDGNCIVRKCFIN